MDTEFEINPYQPPAATMTGAVEATDAPVLKDPRLLGRLTLFFISAQCVCDVLQAFLPAEAGWSEELQFGNVTTTLLSSIFYLCWLHRCVVNALRIDRRTEVSPGWAIACHFIPFVNWVAPCQVMRRISNCTFRHAPACGMNALIIVWWIAMLTMNVTTKWANMPWMALLSLGSMMIAWITFGIVMTRISRKQAFFRRSDLPTSRRSNIASLATGRIVTPAAMPAGHLPPPRRALLRPIPYDEQAKARMQETGGEW